MRNTTLLTLAAALALTGCATFVRDPAPPPAAGPPPAGRGELFRARG